LSCDIFKVERSVSRKDCCVRLTANSPLGKWC
jgi:hypothetical protein